MTHDCVICFDEIENPCELIETPCGHTFHNSCLTPWFLAKDTCPMCRMNYGKERPGENDSDEEWESDDYGFDEEEDAFRAYFNFDIFEVEDSIMDPIIDQISSVGEDPEGMTSDWMLNHIDGDEVYCIYSLIRDGDSLVRIEFTYNKNQNKMNVYFISRHIFNTNKKYQTLDNWVFKRRANGYFNRNVSYRV
jgi:hypothetical protein